MDILEGPVLVCSPVAVELFRWVYDEQQYIANEADYDKASRILNVAKRIEQRYRDCHGLERLAGM
jgi:hypothetical protein